MSLVEYEKMNNRLLLALASRSPDHRILFAPVLNTLLQTNAVLFVPQSFMLRDVNVTPEFIYSHSFILQSSLSNNNTNNTTNNNNNTNGLLNAIFAQHSPDPLKFILLDGSLGAFDAARDRLAIVGSRVLSHSGFVTNAQTNVVSAPVVDAVQGDRRDGVFALHAPLWSEVVSKFTVPTDPTSVHAIAAAMMAPAGVNSTSSEEASGTIHVLAHTLLDVPRDSGGGVDKLPVVLISDTIRATAAPTWIRSPLKTLSSSAIPSSSQSTGSSSGTGRSGLIDSVKRKASSRFDFLGGLFGSGGAPANSAAAAAAAAATTADDSRPDTADLVTENDALPLAADRPKSAPPTAALSSSLSSSTSATASPASSKTATPAPDVELDAVQQAAVQSAATSAFFTRLSRPEAADVLARLRAFVREFAARIQQGVLPPNKRPAVVRRFVEGMTSRVRQHPHWADASEDEVAALPDALEKYATTKLYKLIFVPDQAPDKAENAKLVERIKSLDWIEPRHLDMAPELFDESKLALAAQQLHQLDDYKPPRDKLICVLNCFAAADHEILTNKGFLSLSQVESHMAANGGAFGDLLVAGYDAERQRLVYETPRQLVTQAARSQQLVELSQHNGGARVSVAVTPDHDMFVERVGGSFGKVRASALVNNDAWSDVKMMATAANGIDDHTTVVRYASANTPAHWSSLSASGMRRELERAFGSTRQLVVRSAEHRDDLVRAALHGGLSTTISALSAAEWCVRLETGVCQPVLSRKNGDSIKYVPYVGRTWCFEMPSGFVVARRVSGSCMSTPLIHGNCCKVLYTIAEGAHRAGADELLPLLIVVVIRANPARLYSHTQYISMYRGAEGLLTEPGYYFTQLMSAVAFLEQCDASRLTITADEYLARMSGQRVPSSAAPVSVAASASPPSDLFALDVPPSVEIEPSSATLPALSAAAAVDRFLECEPRSLTPADVVELLESYRMTVAENASLREQLAAFQRGTTNELFDFSSPTPAKRAIQTSAQHDTTPSLL